MQAHWKKWGPPVYIPVAGYFKLGVSARSGASKSSPAPVGAMGELKGGNLEELVGFFGGGVIG